MKGVKSNMKQKIKYGLIHCHSENSLKDSALTVTDLVKRAKELGTPAITLTDHGVLTGIYEFLRVAKDNDIKAIPGVEAYVQEDDDLTAKSHLVLLAKNYQGYQAICRAVTESNNRIKNTQPRMNMEIIQKYFGKGSKGYGNVIATSACVGGVLSSVLLENNFLNKQIDKMLEKISKYNNPNDPIYLENLKILAGYEDEIQVLQQQKKELKKLAERKFKMKERALSKFQGEKYEKMVVALDEEKAESMEAAKTLKEVESKIKKLKSHEISVKRQCNEHAKTHEHWRNCNKIISEMQSKIISKEQLLEKAKKVALWYREIFQDDFYVELQYHGITEEAYVMPQLAHLAMELNLPIVAANDVHFAYNNQEDVRARAIMCSLRFGKWRQPRKEDYEYYIKTDEELVFWLSKILNPDIVNKAMLGIQDIVDKCHVQFPLETHFPKFKGGAGNETSVQRLRRLTEEGILAKYPNQTFPYRERIEYELEIIEKMQYTDYLCIVQDYIAFARQFAKNNPEQVGYGVGPGRGSAAGSLVCYLIGITSIDPMPLGLMFERFLNPDRVSSPDIDVDFAQYVREAALNYVKQKYGEEAVCCILTKGTLAARSAIRDVARIRGSELFDDTKHFASLGDMIARAIPAAPNALLSDCEEELREKFKENEDAQEIISDAKLIEGTIKTYGIHAAGVIIADNGDVGEYTPLLWNNEKNQWCTQCDMSEAEAQAGLLKFDFLGLKNLDIISNTIRAIKRNYGKTIDIEKVPQESAIYREIFQQGKTNFIFQFESAGMQNMLKKFKPENLEHLILLNAVFRPGPLQYIDEICNVKAGKIQPTYICEAAREVLQLTYGYPVFQEQIMELCNKVAGFTLGEADSIRRFMSKKKADKMAEYKPKFIQGLIHSGANPDTAESFWEQLMNFASYAFNKSHAAVYATLAYYTAWLKYHYPTEYMAAVMNFATPEKLPAMAQECKDLGVKLLPPQINHSLEVFSGKNNEISFGLGYVKNVANSADLILKERQINGLFVSFKDFLKRTHLKINVIESLIDAGVLDDWCSNRKAMKVILPDLLKNISKISKNQEALVKCTNDKRRENIQKKLDTYTEQLNQIILPISIMENKQEKLKKENELLGMYVSGHPLDEYPAANNMRSTMIADIQSNDDTVTVCGYINECKLTKRKLDGKEMAFCQLEDPTGIIKVCCFTKVYEKYKNLIQEGAVLSIKGKVQITETHESSEDQFSDKEIFAETISNVEPKKHTVLITVQGLHRWAESVYDYVKIYENDNGLPVVVHDAILGELRHTILKVVPDILTENIPNCEIRELDI